MWRLWLIASLLLIPVAFADDSINISIEEQGKVTNYFNTYWVVNVNGTGTISNPSDRDLFDVRLYYDLLTLDIIPLSGDAEYEASSLVFNRIPAQSTRTFTYQIVGITAQSPSLVGKGVLYTALSKRTPRIYSDVFGQLQKSEVEDASITGAPRRLVSVTLDNPSSLPYTIESLRIIKTPALNPNTVLEIFSIINESDPYELGAGEFYVKDILDPSSVEGEVYWLQSDVFISDIFLDDQNRLTRLTETNLSAPEEAFNFTNFTDNSTSRLIDGKYLLRKQVSPTVALPGQPISISLSMYNLDDQLRSYELTDTVPVGFFTDQDLVWEGNIPARGSVTQRYRAVLNETTFAGVDVFPAAKAIIAGIEIFSQEIAFIRQYSPDDTVYLQKRVSYRDEDSVEVTLQIQNLGKNPLVNTELREFLTDSDVFSEISLSPVSKGHWDLPEISQGETYSVTYVTRTSETLSVLPMLYGVNSKSLLRTIILENVVREGWSFAGTRGIELLGLGLLIGVPALLVWNKRRAEQPNLKG